MLRRCRKRTLWGLSLAAAVTALLAAVSPYPHLCPWFARVPWLASTCPSRASKSEALGKATNPAPEAEDGGALLPAPDIAALPLVTREELALHDGNHDPKKYPIWMAIDGVVLDVSGDEGRRFYAPGKDYAVFAGTDSTRALALGSLDESDVARGDDVSDFNEWQREELTGRILFYLEKYPAVGKLGSNGGKLASMLLASSETKRAPTGFGISNN